MTFQAWEMVFLNSTTFHDQGAPWPSLRKVQYSTRTWWYRRICICTEWSWSITTFDAISLELTDGRLTVHTLHS